MKSGNKILKPEVRSSLLLANTTLICAKIKKTIQENAAIYNKLR